MPSIDQCDSVDGSTAALSSNVEDFDTFRVDPENGKDSDSDESFHLAVESDEEDADNVESNDMEKETEDEILNKIDNCTPENLDPDAEDKLLNGDDEEQKVAVCKTEINFQCYDVEKNYADNLDGEFKSLYESDDKIFEMEVVDEAEASDEEAKAEEAEVETSDEGTNAEEGDVTEEANREQINEADVLLPVESVSEEEAVQQLEENKAIINEVATEKQMFQTENLEDLEPDTTTSEVEKDKNNEDETVEKLESPETTFKVPEPVAFDENKGEDESDLLDISMIRETEEDDACAIEEAIKETIDKKEAELDEKTDDDLNESMDATDNEKDDNDSRMDLDDQNDDSRMSSIGVSESSKDGTSDDCTMTMDDDDSEHEDETLMETETDTTREVRDKGAYSEKTVETVESGTQADELIEDKDHLPNEKTLEISQIEPEEASLVELEETSQVDSGKTSAVEPVETSPAEPEKTSQVEPEESLQVEHEKTSSVEPEKASEVEHEEASRVEPGQTSHIELEESLRVEPKETSQLESEENSQVVPEETSQVESEADKSSITNENLIHENVAGPLDDGIEEPDAAAATKRPLSEDSCEMTAAKKPRLSEESSEMSAAKKTRLSEESREMTAAKKPRLSEEIKEADTPAPEPVVSPQPTAKYLNAFSEFLKAKNLKDMCSRSDLEQFVLQKVAEAITNVSKDSGMLQVLKSYENKIDRMKKDMTTLLKQCRDLEIVNKKLMSDLKMQKRPLVPLKITRSVGLQVRLNPVTESLAQQRKRQSGPAAAQTPSPQKSATTAPIVRNRLSTGTPNTPVRQVLPSPQKTPISSGPNTVLSQALQKRPLAKRTTPVAKKTATPSKPSTNGVIDLTDEDDNKPAVVRPAVSTAASTPKPVSKSNTSVAKKIVSPQMTVAQGIRLAPGSVLTSTAGGGQQMLYVLPTTSGGQQKVALLMSPNNSIPSQLNGAVVQNKTINIRNAPVPSPSTAPLRPKHPAPLPAPPRVNLDPKLKPLLPKPILTIKKIDTGIILQWKMPYNLELYEGIASYQLYAYQETNAQPSTDMWRKVGDVKALALPMACTLTQFADKNKYYFAVRSVDVHKRIGAFSDPEQINL